MEEGSKIGAGNFPKILMVDDKPENLIALERLLKDMPLQLFKAQSGNEALRLTLKHDFALGLLDIQMPEMDGYELAEILRSESRTAKMPFIFISAIYTSNINVFKGYDLGAFSYITKPFDPQVLVNKVNFFVEKHQQEQELVEARDLLEKRVTERTKDLQRSNRELEQFAYVASHDLQEPLRAITSYLQLLQRHNENGLDEKSNRYIQVAVEGAKRMKSLIDALLDYSRVTRGESENEDVDLNELLQNILVDLRTRIAESGAKIQYGNLPVVRGSKIQLHLLFQNLISNAIKFRQKERVPQISITVPEDTDWHICITDNGIGIDAEFYDRVFVIFQRLHTRQDYEGTGIGLAICKRIVEQHNGKIWLDSEIEKGTSVHVILPKSDIMRLLK